MAPHTTPPGDSACPEHDPGPGSGPDTGPLHDSADLGPAAATGTTPGQHPTPAPAPASDSRAPTRKQLTRLAHAIAFITDRIRLGEWTYEDFPTQDQLRDMLGCGRITITEALQHLELEGLLVRQAVRGRNVARLLPLPASGQAFPASAAEMVRDSLMDGILSGRWAGTKFPTIVAMTEEFRCSLRVASEAIQMLCDDGWVHRITAELDNGDRGHRWLPVEVPPYGPDEIIRQIENDVCSGALTGLLPTRQAMARELRVNSLVVAEAYRRLEQRGLIAFGWLPDLSAKGCFVVKSAPPGVIYCQSKALASAEVLRRRIPDWLIRGSGDTWFRSCLPTISALTHELGSDYVSTERAVAVLVRAGVVERGPFAKPVYLAVPPAPGAAPDLRFDYLPTKPGATWAPCQHNGMWRPLPTCDDDPLLDGLDIELGRKPRPDSELPGRDEVNRGGGLPG